MNTSATEIGGAVIKNILAKNSLDGREIDEVIIENLLSAGHGQGGGRKVAIAGGVESMSQSKFVPKANVRTGQKIMNFNIVNTMANDALTDAFDGYHMGVTAENIAEKYNISMEAQDKLAMSLWERQ